MPRKRREYKAYLVSNAHFDSQWNWDVQRSISEYIPKTMDRNLFLLEKYPDYIFNFEGGIKYSWMKEYFPEKYDLVKKYIRQGRWHVTGSTWDATDTNIPSPESFTRNILYGQHFYREEFGVEGTDIFLPDCFGFGWTLPTIAAPVTDMVEVSVPYCGKKVSVYGPDGKQVPCQVLSSEPDGMTVLLFQASAPAAGYAVYDVRKGGRSSWDSSVEVTANTIENSVYKVTLDGNGDICSIVDKRCGRELVEKGKAVRLALFTGNPSYNWPAWEIMKSTVDSAPVSVTDGVRISVAESGPVRGSLRVERTYGDSRFVQYVTLSEGGESDRIDIRSEIDWQTTDALLKAEFPLSVSNPEAVYDLGVGSTARGNNVLTAYEVYAQQWADLTDKDGSYGVSVLNDSKYGWDKPADNTIRLTLLHTPSTKGGYSYQSRQDFGHHEFTYSIVGHEGDYRDGRTVAKAELLNQPLKAFIVPKHRGDLGRTFSFAEVTGGSVAVRALKHAEDMDGYVVRLYETSGRGTDTCPAGQPSGSRLCCLCSLRQE